MQPVACDRFHATGCVGVRAALQYQELQGQELQNQELQDQELQDQELQD